MAKQLDTSKLMSEEEWRALGVQQSRGWEHYMIHRPEPHILLFRRPIGTDPRTGKVPELHKKKTAVDREVQ
jgi:cyclin-dependent kinase regulatory subunit CKS1